MLQRERSQYMNPVFQFKKSKNPSNKLVNRKLNTIKIDERHRIVECIETQSEPSVTRAEHALQFDSCASYFEVEIFSTTLEDTINIGLMTKDANNKQFLGKSTSSLGYFKGDLFLEKKKVGEAIVLDKLKQHDRIGMGINCYKRTLFVVWNGAIVLDKVDLPNWSEFIPAVGLSLKEQKVGFYFAPEQFKFNFREFCDNLQAELKQQIQTNSHASSNQIYSLIHEHLAFNKYSETLALLNQKQIDFHRLNKYTKNPAISPSINLGKESEVQDKEADEAVNEPLQTRSRVMSERINDGEEQSQLRRKNTEFVQCDENHRKESFIDNISNISNAPLESQQKEACLQEEQQEMLDENEQFLENERLRIVQHIRNLQMEDAIDLIKTHIPQLFQEDYILAFMMAHVFLQKVRKESNKEALNFSRGQKDILQKHYSTLCPFYSSNCKEIEWKPLNVIFFALAYNPQKQIKSPNSYDMVSDSQFHTFASYINQLILRKMGYLGCSRLTYFCHHLKKVQEKIKQLRGMNCGIDIRL